MDTNSTMFLLLMAAAGVVTVTFFYYGAQFVLRLLEVPDQEIAPRGSLKAAHGAPLSGARALHTASVAEPEPSV